MILISVDLQRRIDRQWTSKRIVRNTILMSSLPQRRRNFDIVLLSNSYVLGVILPFCLFLILLFPSFVRASSSPLSDMSLLFPQRFGKYLIIPIPLLVWILSCPFVSLDARIIWYYDISEISFFRWCCVASFLIMSATERNARWIWPSPNSSSTLHRDFRGDLLMTLTRRVIYTWCVIAAIPDALDVIHIQTLTYQRWSARRLSAWIFLPFSHFIRILRGRHLLREQILATVPYNRRSRINRSWCYGSFVSSSALNFRLPFDWRRCQRQWLSFLQVHPKLWDS